MKLFIGYDDFKQVVEKKLDFVDKSLFIQAILEDQSQVILITRPRRFGKSFNLSMLHYFFASEAFGSKTKGLFEGLNIAKKPECMAYQGQHPVIFISLKDLNESTPEMFYQNFVYLVKELYEKHRVLLDSPHLYDNQKEIFTQLLLGTADEIDYKKSLEYLTLYLHAHYGKRPILLIDEYDTPLQYAYLKGYYEHAVNWLRGFLSPILKSNPYLEKAVLTGILRVSKESLFSGLNNVEVYSMLKEGYSEYFGFTEPEVKSLFEQAQLEDHLEEAKKWYNGYQIGNTLLYNPWSIVHCIKEKGRCEPYWINTSGNDLVKTLLLGSSTDFKHDFEQLLAGHSIDIPLTEYFVFPELKDNELAIWSLLLMTGYLKVIGTHLDAHSKMIYSVAIPNHEIRNLYDQMIEQWLFKGKSFKEYEYFLNDLLSGNIESFTQRLEQVILQIASFHDMAREPEAFYQGLMLGLVVGLRGDHYEIKSNRESGLGRYDIVIIPNDIHALGIIIELKSVKSSAEGEALQNLLCEESKVALTQIQAKNYSAEFKQRGHKKTLNLGIAFCGKQLYIAAK